jgi:hypothetical protein
LIPVHAHPSRVGMGGDLAKRGDTDMNNCGVLVYPVFIGDNSKREWRWGFVDHNDRLMPEPDHGPFECKEYALADALRYEMDGDAKQ